MEMLASLGPGTVVATVMVVVSIAFVLVRQGKTGRLFEPMTKNVLICGVSIFVAGATSANGLFHFVHGILNFSEFPAPYAKIFGNGLFSDVSNTIWGLFNFAVAIFVILSYRKSLPGWVIVVCWCAGFAFIALMLRYVFLLGYFQTHAF